MVFVLLYLTEYDYIISVYQMLFAEFKSDFFSILLNSLSTTCVTYDTVNP